ncbi:PapB/FocB family fimbrial expression transcriptional regulator [Vibrio sp. 1978]|uniref:PapB/FocB family fimbrial expression transcriptional regulator n=1 Tax=Vibrio sp. 1978 TaxID=3074585 RepID=UPI00296734B0|nr:PapB/FocB family fimbrial expression transcriptional regulator [Vibrio sp. 1978]MDW3058696.1 hypothetical protein [Vibrio sp. 1978]
MIQGMESKQRVELVLSLTKMRSEQQIEALLRYFVDGLNFSACAELAGITESNFQRAIDRVQAIDTTIEKIKELDWQRFKSQK